MHPRPSQPTDADRLFQVWHDAVKATHHFLSAEDFDAIAGDVRNYVADASFWVIDDEVGQPAAFMSLTGAHIDALFVDPVAHGRGIGRALVVHARQFAENGVVTVDVNEQNEGAVAFYERVGFVAFDRSAVDDAGRPYPLVHLRQSINR